MQENSAKQDYLEKIGYDFSNTGSFLLFRSIRFPYRLNPLSLTSESVAQTEIRKLSRKVNAPTRIYDSSKKDGNPNRSLTLIARNQKIFGKVGYGLVKENFDDIHYFSPDMDLIVSGYGKTKNFKKFDKMSENSLRKEMERTKRDSAFLKPTNEVIMDIKNPNEIKFIYYSNDMRMLQTFDGIEFTELKMNQLYALYLQNEFKKTLGLKLPICEYSPNGTILKEIEFSDKKIKDLLKYVITCQPNDKHILPIMSSFSQEIKETPSLENLVKTRLNEQLTSVKNSKYDTSFYYSKCLNINVNLPLFEINSLIALSRTLMLFDRAEDSAFVAEKSLNTLLAHYSSSSDKIYDARDNCTHPDIHLRTFTDIVADIRNLMPSDAFIKFSPEIDKTFDLVCENSKAKGLNINLYIGHYKNLLATSISGKDQSKTLSDKELPKQAQHL